jgi:RNA polymerase sigma-70 factor (ECF subfamily)
MAAEGATEGDAAEFEQQRPRLVAIAHRMLGSRADADDAVQEVWLRFARQDRDRIDSLPAWLTTVLGRVCIDMIRARSSRAESMYGDEPPEWIVTDDVPGPEDNAVVAESVGLALLVVLDTLTPDERLAFVLHDTFAVPFEEVGRIIGKSTDAAKMLASRARRKVRGAEHPGDLRRKREVVDAFLAASRNGDFEGLLRVLHPDVIWRVHSPRGERVTIGAVPLATQAARGVRTEIVARGVLVNGRPGIAAWREDGRPLGVMACTVVGDRIVEVESVLDRSRLEAMGLTPLAR